jgi:hypothetical protein
MVSVMSAQPDAPHILDEVGKALSASISVFAIGGNIDLTANGAANPGSIAIRWDSGEWDAGHKVSFPLVDDAAPSRAFEKLLKDCQPATFGKGREEVLDEEYRKAGKMDRSKFSCDFDLAEHEIINTVTQALMKNADGDADDDGDDESSNEDDDVDVDDNCNCVRAELYTLNVSSPIKWRSIC